MAEVFGVLGVIATFGTIVKAAGKLAKVLLDIADEKSALKDIKGFAEDVHMFYKVIKFVNRSLKIHCRPPERSKDVLKYLNKHKLMDDLNDQSERTIQDIERLLPDLDARNKFSFVCRFKWHFNDMKIRVDALVMRMNGVKANLQLAVSGVMLYLLKQEGKWSSYEEQRLRNEIRIFRYDLSTTRRRMREMGQLNFEDHEILEKILETNNLIVETIKEIKMAPVLGRVEIETMPSAPSVPGQNVSGGDSSTSTRPSRPRSDGRRHSSSLTTPSSRNTAPSSPAANASTQSSAPVISFPSPSRTTESRVADQVINQEASEIAPRDEPTVNYMNSLFHREDIQRHAASLGRHSFSLLFDSKLGFNLITEALALHLGLHIRPPGNQDQAEIHFSGNDVGLSLGKVSLDWDLSRPFTGLPHRDERIPVQCFVLRNKDFRIMIFGFPTWNLAKNA